jgi:hypothetical protein
VRLIVWSKKTAERELCFHVRLPFRLGVLRRSVFLEIPWLALNQKPDQNKEKLFLFALIIGQEQMTQLTINNCLSKRVKISL